MLILASVSPRPEGALARAVHSLCVEGAAVAFADSAEQPAPILPAERSGISRAVASRQREFAAGRSCARAALDRIGVSAVAIPIGPDRAPLWPAGAVGSITHCPGFVGALVAHADAWRGLGFDAEGAGPLGDEIRTMICSSAELEWISVTRSPSSGDWPKVIFSAKEAVHKCIAPLTGTMLDFLDVTISLDPARGTFRARAASTRAESMPLLRRVTGRFALTGQFVLTAATIPP